MKQTTLNPDVEMIPSDFDTARREFEKYVNQLPETLSDLKQSLNTRDIFSFKQLIHKLIPQGKAVGLADLTRRLSDLDAKCMTAKELVLYEIEIQDILNEIKISGESTGRILDALRAFTNSN